MTSDRPFWHVNDAGYFEAPGMSVLIFHNAYPEGKQGGIEIIQHGERVATCGDLRWDEIPEQWDALPEAGERIVDADRGEVRVPLRFEDAHLAYVLRVEPDGESLMVTVDMDHPRNPSPVGEIGFNLELYPGAYKGTAYRLGDRHGRFPEQWNGPVRRTAAGQRVPVPLAQGAKLVAAPDQPLHRLTVESLTGDLMLLDGRSAAQNNWFVIRERVPPNAGDRAVVWRITPHAVPTWRRPPVLCMSQVGYHPDQAKRAILELDPRTETLDEVVLERLTDQGREIAWSRTPARWGAFLRYAYAVADFSEVREPGMYVLRYGETTTSPFAIDAGVYQTGVWQPTLETFFPVQMCHVEVRDRYRVWHGACHLDDALQAPPSHEHFDGYRQYEETETAYQPYESIPHLNVGGWHDAGDYDLAAGSQARTTHTLVLIRELFGVDTDQTTVKPDQRLVMLHAPDGVPDIVEQIAHGALNLLGGYRAAGHSFHGIIANAIEQYVHLGDPVTMTDNRVYDATLDPVEVEGDRAGTMDDRWAFTNHDTALEYRVAATLAGAARVLHDYDEALADECLQTAREVWDEEHAGSPVSQPGAYVPRNREAMEVIAAAELFLTTGKMRYYRRILDLWEVVERQVMQVGGAVVRALMEAEDREALDRLRPAVAGAAADYEAACEENPFGIRFRPQIWGVGWQIQGEAVQLTQLRMAYPDLVDRELVLRVLNYMLGCHPASNTSLASGVGGRSMTVAYGINRADYAYIPGGVPAGPALIRPDFPELKEPWPFLWQQTEYVMGGAADYVFCVLAADQMLNAS
jgi:hypothetical protein